jgi:argininosuccinate synthase
MTKEAKKVVLAYSGGLDTSVMIAWLKEQYGLSVVAVLVDAGGLGGLEDLRQKALAIGAVEAFVIDAKDEFAHDFVLPALAANALYEEKYPLVSALSRPLISKLLVEMAHKSGADAVAHGCTAKGNDQVRFELSIRALDPSLEVLAPVREWGMTREQSMEYAAAHDIPIPFKKESPYSIDENLWGRAVECGPLEDPWLQPPEEAFDLTLDPTDAPDAPAYMEIGFESGEPVALDAKEMPLGIKSREVYEAPGALPLIMAHRELEDLVLPRELLHFKRGLEQKFAVMTYNGGWFDPLMDALRAFMAETQKRLNGTVRLKFFKGSCHVVGRTSPNSLYELGLATYGGGDAFSHEAAKGFTELWGLPLEVWAKRGKKE